MKLDKKSSWSGDNSFCLPFFSSLIGSEYSQILSRKFKKRFLSDKIRIQQISIIRSLLKGDALRNFDEWIAEKKYQLPDGPVISLKEEDAISFEKYEDNLEKKELLQIIEVSSLKGDKHHFLLSTLSEWLEDHITDPLNQEPIVACKVWDKKDDGFIRSDLCEKTLRERLDEKVCELYAEFMEGATVAECLSRAEKLVKQNLDSQKQIIAATFCCRVYSGVYGPQHEDIKKLVELTKIMIEYVDLSFREKSSYWSSLCRFILGKGIKDTGLATTLILLLPKVTSSFDQSDHWSLISCLVMRDELVKLLDSMPSDYLLERKEVIEDFFSLFRSFPREIRVPIYL